MKKSFCLAALALSLAVSAVPAFAQGSSCGKVVGRKVETVIPAPGDPYGRVLGATSGDIKASITAYITTLITDSAGVSRATLTEVWMLGAQDTIYFTGQAVFTPIPGQPLGTVADSLTLTAIGGTGLFTGATGTLQVSGAGFNLFGPNAAPGKTFFDVGFTGTICRPHL